MFYQKKYWLVVLSSLLFATHIMADTVRTVHGRNTGTHPKDWKISEDNVQYLLYYMDSNLDIDFYVAPKVKDKDRNTFSSDVLTFECNGVIKKVVPNSHSICSIKDQGSVRFYIEQEDFKHGAQGWFIENYH